MSLPRAYGRKGSSFAAPITLCLFVAKLLGSTYAESGFVPFVLFVVNSTTIVRLTRAATPGARAPSR